MKPLFSKFLIQVSVIAVLLASMFSCQRQPHYCILQGYAQGGTYSVKFNMAGVRMSEDRIRSSVDSILTLVDTTLSGYNQKSILSRFNAGEAVFLNPMFRDIFKLSKGYFDETSGAVDVAAGPLFDIWGFGFKNNSFPTDEEVAQVRSSCGMDKIQVDLDSIPAESRPALNFNAVAQGYTSDQIASFLHSLGVHDMLVDIGEIFCEGVNQKGLPWKVGVDRPIDGNMTPGADLDGIWQGDGSACGIVTSGNYRKFYEKDGKKYSHTVDPRTGYPVTHSLLSATIVAPTAVQADAYATYCMVIGLEAAKEFIESRDDVQGYLIFDSENGMDEWASSGFNLISEGD